LQAGSELEQLITKQIRSSPSIVAVECVFIEWGGSFTLAHTAAALSRLAKLSRSGNSDSKLQQQLLHKWLQLLPQAGGHHCASALCACLSFASLGHSAEQVDAVWAPTWAPFMQRVQRKSAAGLVLQDIADVLHAAARLHKQPGPGELPLLARKWLQLLPQAGAHQCASALRACVNVNKELADAVWAPTWAAFMQRMKQGSGEGLVSRDIADAVCAAATLRKQPGPGELQLLVQIFLRIEGSEGASDRVVRLVEGIEQLSQLPGWQGGICKRGGIRKQDMQQLLRGVQRRLLSHLPGWQAGSSEQDMQQLLGLQRGLLTRQISSAKSLVQLQHICHVLSGSFQVSHTASALEKFRRLSRSGSWQRDSGRYGQVLQLLVLKWLQQLPGAGARECCEVLAACVILSEDQNESVWASTWAVLMQHVQRGSGGGLLLQQVAGAVHAAAKLGKQPGPGELQPLVRPFVRPGVFNSWAKALGCGKLFVAIKELSKMPGWQGGVTEQDMQELDEGERLELGLWFLLTEISSSETIQQLQRSCQRSGYVFEAIHTAEALRSFSKLSRTDDSGSSSQERDWDRECGRDSQLLQLLERKWLQQLPTADVWGCSHVLFTCGHLGEEQSKVIWAPTWAAFMQHVQRGSGEKLTPRNIADAMRAAAMLRKQPGRGELQLLVQAFLQPDVQESAKAWHVSSLVGVVKTLSQLPGWQGRVSDEAWQQLLDRQCLLNQRQARGRDRQGQPS
jgi:hypothetical protein